MIDKERKQVVRASEEILSYSEKTKTQTLLQKYSKQVSSLQEEIGECESKQQAIVEEQLQLSDGEVDSLK